MLRAYIVLASLLIGCGPSTVAQDPPPAELGAAAVRFGSQPDIAFEATPVRCGTPEGFTPVPGQLVCELANRDAAGLTTARLDLTLRTDSLDELPEGTELRTRSELELVNVSVVVDGVGRGAGDSSWDGTLVVTLGPPATPRSAILDGALSSAFDDPRIAMTFESLPIVIVRE